MHVPAVGRLYRPAGQMDGVAVVDPSGHEYPAVQVPLQADDLAVVLLKVPAAHGVHTAAPARLNVPAGQTDAVVLADPAGQA